MTVLHQPRGVADHVCRRNGLASTDQSLAMLYCTINLLTRVDFLTDNCHRLAKRTGEPQFSAPSRIRSGEWLDRYKREIPAISRAQRTLTFASLAEKNLTDSRSQGNPLGSGRRGVRTLPFSENVFRLITKRFYTHGSISRVISRADVQTFSCSEVEMGQPDGQTCLADSESFFQVLTIELPRANHAYSLQL